MEIVKIAGFALVAVIAVALLRQYLPAYGIVALAGSSVVFIGMFVRYLQPLLQWMEGLSAFVAQEEFQCLLKAAGVAMIAQITQELCKDAGMNSMGAAVELAGRCLVLAAALPMFQSTLQHLLLILQ